MILSETFSLTSTVWAAGPWIADAEEALPFLGVAVFWVGLIITVVAAMVVISARWRADRHGASRVRKLARKLLAQGTYRQVHDVAFETSEGTVRIDHVVISPFGVFVIQAMHQRGEISGKTFAPDWTQTSGDKAVTFPNPLRPNFNRKLALGNLLGLGEEQIFSVIAFTEGASFSFPMPDNVTRGSGFAEYILSRQAVLIDSGEVPRLEAALRSAMVRPSGAGKRKKSARPMHARYMNLLKFAAMAAALAGGSHALHNTTQFPDFPDPLSWFSDAAPESSAEVTRSRPARQQKKPRSDAYGFLTVKAERDTRLTLSESESGSEVLTLRLNAGESREIELKKGYYKAEIVQNGQVRVRIVSFIGSTGTLEL
jgi:hypothetical protein